MIIGTLGGNRRPSEPAGRHQAEGEVLLVLVGHEGRIEKPTDGDDGDAAAAGEGREEGRCHEAHHGQAAGHPAEPGREHLDQAMRRSALRQQIAGKREQGNRDEQRRVGELLAEDVVRSAGDARVGKGSEEQHRRRAEDRKEGRAENGEHGEEDDPNAVHRSALPFRVFGVGDW